MSCIYPVPCYFLLPSKRGGDYKGILHNVNNLSPATRSLYYEAVRPCGQCIECRLKKSRYSAIRCVHEASMHEDNCFLTLTYSDEFLPADRSISTRHMQLFWKKLRKHFSPKLFKYLAAGEYGDGDGERFRLNAAGKRIGDNPHYHACVFGIDFSDKIRYSRNELGDYLYSSKILDRIWGMGRCLIGDVTFESAAYVARYTLKKIYGDDADDHYCGRMPEKCWWSTGVSRAWFDKWYSDIYPSDELVIRNGTVCTPPPYYDKLLLKHDPDLFQRVEDQRAGKLIISKNNVDLVRNSLNHRSMAVSEVVRCAQLRVGRLDKGR